MAQKENYHTIGYGNKDGELKFGHIHNDNVISGVMLRNKYDPRHYVTLDQSGDARKGRKGGTINRCPGSYQVKCGDDVQDGIPAFYVEAVNGDLVFSATKGRIRFQAENIEFHANGADNKNGVISLNANEKVEVNAKNVEINASAVAKFFSSGTTKIIGNAVLDFYGGMTACATGASKGKPSKYAATPADENNTFRG